VKGQVLLANVRQQGRQITLENTLAYYAAKLIKGLKMFYSTGPLAVIRKTNNEFVTIKTLSQYGGIHKAL
jgi:hypothetical protein